MKYFQFFGISSLSAKLPLSKMHLPKRFYIVVVSLISATDGINVSSLTSFLCNNLGANHKVSCAYKSAHNVTLFVAKCLT